MLEDVLVRAYETAGLDSALATYHGLHDKYYGRFTYDFGSVPLTDVATKLQGDGHAEDALRLLALNVEMNPQSVFAKRQHAASAVSLAFQTQGVDAGTKTYRELRERYGAEAFPEFALNRIGYGFLGDGRADLAIPVFQLNAEAFTGSTNSFDSLAEAYMKHGDRDLAVRNYEKALELDPANQNAKEKLETLRHSGKK